MYPHSPFYRLNSGRNTMTFPRLFYRRITNPATVPTVRMCRQTAIQTPINPGMNQRAAYPVKHLTKICNSPWRSARRKKIMSNNRIVIDERSFPLGVPSPFIFRLQILLKSVLNLNLYLHKFKSSSRLTHLVVEIHFFETVLKFRRLFT